MYVCTCAALMHNYGFIV